MTRHDPAVENLLLATSYLRRDRSQLALRAKRAWIDVALHLDVVRGKPTPDAARALFKKAIELCEAAGINTVDLVEVFNDRQESGERAAPPQFDQLLDDMAGALLALMMQRMDDVRGEQERESA